MEFPRLRWVVLVALLAALGAAAWHFGRSAGAPASYPVPGEGARITVEVLNGSGVDGLARDVTRALRHHGVDVVSFGTATEANVDSTRIIVRRGDSTKALAVRQALGFGQVVVDPDPKLLLDVTVLVGADATGLHGYP